MSDEVKLTKDLILGWTAAELKREYGKGPARQAEIVAVMNAPDEDEIVDEVVAAPVETVQPVEDPQLQADRLAAEATANAEAERVAAEKAAADDQLAKNLASAGITIERDAAGNILWIVQRYQAKDDAGNPIGSPTYFKVRTWDELAVKQQQAHENATRYADRLKNRKPAPKKVEPVVKQLSEEELQQAHQELNGKDPVKAAAAVRKIVGADEIEEERKRLRAAEADAQAAKVAYAWMRKHIHDFNPCEANANILVAYIADNNLQFSEEAFDEAFRENESQLAPVEVPTPIAQAPANIAPAPAPLAVVPAVVPVAAAPTAVVAAPVVPPAPAIPAAVVPRPGVNSGVVPGQASGQRPAAAQKSGLTKAIVNGWTPAEMRKEMAKGPTRRAEIERVMNS